MIIRASVGEGDTIVVDFDKDKQEIVTSVKKSEPTTGESLPETSI